MQDFSLEKSDRFHNELDVIVNFIAEDSVTRAIEFYDELIIKIEKIPFNPHAYRMNTEPTTEYSRELIFKGYIIPFFIDNSKKIIIILGIFNQNIWEV